LDAIEVARIIKPHGLGGEVGVLMHWVGSDALRQGVVVRLQFSNGTSAEKEISRVRESGKGFLVKFVGVDDRNAAELLRDARVSLDRSQLAQPEAGENFLVDLVGLSVYGPDSVLLGRIVEVASYPSVDALVIERSDGGRVEQPWVDEWVQPISEGDSAVRLKSLDGLVEA
jgi:16S rRNA processing protein RimM